MRSHVRDIEAENSALQARVQDLEFEIAEMRGTPTDWAMLAKHFKVGKKVALIMIVLSRGSLCSHDQLLAASGSTEASPGAVRTNIKHARKTNPNIVIDTVYGGCYQMRPESCLFIRRLLKKDSGQ